MSLPFSRNNLVRTPSAQNPIPTPFSQNDLAPPWRTLVTVQVSLYLPYNTWFTVLSWRRDKEMFLQHRMKKSSRNVRHCHFHVLCQSQHKRNSRRHDRRDLSSPLSSLLSTNRELMISCPSASASGTSSYVSNCCSFLTSFSRASCRIDFGTHPKSLDHIVSGCGSCKSSATAFNSVYISKLPSDSSIIANVLGFTEAGVGIYARFSG